MGLEASVGSLLRGDMGNELPSGSVSSISAISHGQLSRVSTGMEHHVETLIRLQFHSYMYLALLYVGRWTADK